MRYIILAMRLFVRTSFACAVLLLSAKVVLFAENGDSSGLFIKTSPIAASVEINGVPEPRVSPLFKRDLKPGRYSITVSKPGFTSYTEDINVTPGAIAIIDATLSRNTISPIFPEGKNIILNERNVFSQEELLSLPPGVYEIRKSGEIVRITSRYPKQDAIAALNFSIPIVALVTGISALNDALRPAGETPAISPVTISGIAVTGILAAANIALNLNKRNYFRNFPVETLKPGDVETQALAAYDKAERMLEANRLQEALSLYSHVCIDYRDSIYYPLSLYKIARIHFILGDLSLVGAELLIIKERFPLPELYDKACKTLADLYFRQGRFNEALKELKDMLFIDPLYTEEAVDLYKAEILEAWYAEDPTVIEKTIASFVYLSQVFSASQNIDTYLFKAAYYLYRNDKAAEALRYLDRITDREGDLGPSIDNLRVLITEPEDRAGDND